MISDNTWTHAHSTWAHAHARRGQICVDTGGRIWGGSQEQQRSRRVLTRARTPSSSHNRSTATIRLALTPGPDVSTTVDTYSLRGAGTEPSGGGGVAPTPRRLEREERGRGGWERLCEKLTGACTSKYRVSVLWRSILGDPTPLRLAPPRPDSSPSVSRPRDGSSAAVVPLGKGDHRLPRSNAGYRRRPRNHHRPHATAFWAGTAAC